MKNQENSAVQKYATQQQREYRLTAEDMPVIKMLQELDGSFTPRKIPGKSLRKLPPSVQGLEEGDVILTQYTEEVIEKHTIIYDFQKLGSAVTSDEMPKFSKLMHNLSEHPEGYKLTSSDVTFLHNIEPSKDTPLHKKNTTTLAPTPEYLKTLKEGDTICKEQSVESTVTKKFVYDFEEYRRRIDVSSMKEFSEFMTRVTGAAQSMQI